MYKCCKSLSNIQITYPGSKLRSSGMVYSLYKSKAKTIKYVDECLLNRQEWKQDIIEERVVSCKAGTLGGVGTNIRRTKPRY